MHAECASCFFLLGMLAAFSFICMHAALFAWCTIIISRRIYPHKIEGVSCCSIHQNACTHSTECIACASRLALDGAQIWRMLPYLQLKPASNAHISHTHTHNEWTLNKTISRRGWGQANLSKIMTVRTITKLVWKYSSKYYVEGSYYCSADFNLCSTVIQTALSLVSFVEIWVQWKYSTISTCKKSCEPTNQHPSLNCNDYSVMVITFRK